MMSDDFPQMPDGPREFEVYYGDEEGGSFGNDYEDAAKWWARCFLWDFQQSYPGSTWKIPEKILMREVTGGMRGDWREIVLGPL